MISNAGQLVSLDLARVPTEDVACLREALDRAPFPRSDNRTDVEWDVEYVVNDPGAEPAFVCSQDAVIARSAARRCSRAEVETLISAPSDKVPADRRMLDGLLFLGAMRFGEASALAWADYEAAASPLGRFVIERSYSTELRAVKETKTDDPREMPCIRRSRACSLNGSSAGSSATPIASRRRVSRRRVSRRRVI